VRLWERVWIVLAQAACPSCVQRWGQARDGKLETAQWWRKAFVVAAQHPRWGAEMAAAAGATPQAVALIQRHQDKLTLPMQGHSTREEALLRALQSVDDLN
jgi:hypothetical protein